MDKHRLGAFAVVMLSVLGCSSGQDALPPGPLIGEVGGNVTFATTHSSAGPEFLIIAWSFRNGSTNVNVITSAPGGSSSAPEFEGRVSVNRTTGSLELRELRLRDSGEYAVTLTLNSGITQTGQTTLLVYERIANVTVRASATDLVEFNDTVELTCSTSGSSLIYQWRNGSSDITASERVHLSNDNRSLTISRVLRSDRGPLFCTVYNAISSGTSQPVFLNISFGPDNVEVTVDPPKEFHTSGSNVTLSCSAQSSPAAEFKWAFNGTMLDTEGQNLTLENIQENQSGNYTCWAHNSITLRSKPSDPLLLSFIEKISGANVTGPTEVLIAGKNSANLSCQSSTGTLISREWLKDGHPLSPSNTITFSGDNSIVSIDPVQGTDNGQYQCRLTNPVSTVTASYNLTVNYGPEDVVIQGLHEIVVGHTVVLTCSASSVPPATFTWSLDGKDTGVTTEEYTVANATFDHSGAYTCVAENSVTGLRISSDPHLLTIKEPKPPSNLGAILGGVIGGVVGAAAVAGGVVYVKKRKRSSSSTRHNSRYASNHQSNGGEPELAYADISHFKKADGSKIQLASANAAEMPELGQAAVDTQETPYAEVKRK